MLATEIKPKRPILRLNLKSALEPEPSPIPTPAPAALVAPVVQPISKKLRQHESNIKVGGMLCARYPAIFDAIIPKPLAIGIHKQIGEELGVSLTQLSGFLRYWTSRKRYLYQLERHDSKRHDLNGNVVSDVGDDARKVASDKLAEMKKGARNA